ncbi:MAG: hypothetical protein ACF8XB_02830 [Planctomycetota bacterium JB042]
MSARLLLLVAFLAAPTLGTADGPSVSTRPGLVPGPHPVGYRNEVLLDDARAYRTAFDGGATYGGDDGAARPVLLQLWYPAADEAADAAPMPTADYFRIDAGEETAAWAGGLAAHAKDVAAELLLGAPVDALDGAAREVFDGWLAGSTACRRGAAPADGPFPLVVWHSGAGSSYEENALLAEHLASRGYVVAGSAYVDEDGSGYGVDGGETSVDDLELLARHVGALPFVDGARVAFAGHSLGAQACLRAACREAPVADALVLLDSTLDDYGLTTPTFGPILPLVRGATDRIDVPMLVAAGPQAGFVLIDRLARADRTYLQVPGLGHDEFTAQGVTRLVLLARLDALEPDPARAAEVARADPVAARHAELVDAVRCFLDATLGGAGEEFDALAERLVARPLGGDALSAERAPPGTTAPPPYDPSSGRPPTPRQLRPLLAAAGVDGVRAALLGARDASPPAPILSGGMFAAGWLIDLVDAGRADEARALRSAYEEAGVRPLGTLRFLARLAGLVGRPERQRAVLDAAAEIAPDDPEILAALEQLGAPVRDG